MTNLLVNSRSSEVDPALLCTQKHKMSWHCLADDCQVQRRKQCSHEGSLNTESTPSRAADAALVHVQVCIMLTMRWVQ